MTTSDLLAHAQKLLDANRYLTLGTSDASGRPWTSPVYFAADGVRELYWVSATEARHSRNLTERPQVSLVVFDSTVAPYHGRALYAAGIAREVSGDTVQHALTAYPGQYGDGVATLTRDDVTGASPYRLYRATLTDVWVLCPRGPGQPCSIHGLAQDHRARVE